MKARLVKDVVHDYIPLYPNICAFVDTRQFQRLRYIKQLGTSYYVWPGASHNRFEHSLGVAYLARCMVEHLQKEQPSLGLTARDIEAVELAGLCHDLGHGPWSHVWDARFIPAALPGLSPAWKHEDASEMMLDFLVVDNGIQIARDELAFVKALIAGDPTRCPSEEKPFLFEIVSNKRNGIDVDKFDYIMRDNYATGEKGNLSLSRLIHSARVIGDEICYDIKDANQLFEVCWTRYSLHKRIYTHKTARAIEYMIVDALLAAEPHLRFARHIFQPEKYLFLTDDIMQRIQSSDLPELAEARAIFDRIQRRDLYRRVDYKSFEWGHKALLERLVTPTSIVAAARALPFEADDGAGESESERTADGLGESHVIVDIATLHYGMREENPLDRVKFYSKHDPDRCAKAEPGDVSVLMPATFAEVRMQIYVRDPTYFAVIKAAYRAVLQTLPADVLGERAGGEGERVRGRGRGAGWAPSTTVDGTASTTV